MVTGGQGDLHTEKGLVKHIENYKYLGVTLTTNGRDAQDVQNKIRKEKIILRQLRPLLWNNTTSNRT